MYTAQKSLLCVLFLFCLRNHQRKPEVQFNGGVYTNSASGDRNFTIVPIAFPAGIGRKPASPARGSRQRLHAG